MNFNDNKRVFALSAAFALAFAGVMYVGYEGMSSADRASKRLAEIGIAFEDFNAAEFTPNAGNLKALNAATKEVERVNKTLLAQLEAYKKASLNTKPISAVDFQNQVRKAIVDLAARAGEKGIALGSQAATFGMSVYQSQSAIKEEVVYRSYLLSAVEHATGFLVDAGVPSIDKIYCEELPVEAESRLEKAPDYFPFSFELSFTVKRGMLPQIINSIMADKTYFYTITGMSALTETVPSDVAPYKAPAEAITAAGDEDDESGESGKTSSARVLAVRKLGDPNEKVQVHLNMQVLFFNPTTPIK